LLPSDKLTELEIGQPGRMVVVRKQDSMAVDVAQFRRAPRR
jgi:hypothetical protein